MAILFVAKNKILAVEKQDWLRMKKLMFKNLSVLHPWLVKIVNLLSANTNVTRNN
jgi:hypothetical protein